MDPDPVGFTCLDLDPNFQQPGSDQRVKNEFLKIGGNYQLFEKIYIFFSKLNIGSDPDQNQFI